MYKIIISLLAAFSSCTFGVKSHNLKEAIQSDLKHNWPTPQIIIEAGYPVEIHYITTDDGYILEVHRIPYGKTSLPQEGVIRPVVLVQHGLICSSSNWVLSPQEKALGFLLAEAGYDVWLGNFRGNTYSKNHEPPMTSHDLEFWDFSQDQLGEFDLPAMIDYALNATGQEKLFYIGHSMGTTSFMIMCNVKPDYCDKVILSTALAPIAYVEHIKGPLAFISQFTDSLGWILEHLGVGEFIPSGWFMDTISALFCHPGLIQGVCESVAFLICGFDEAQMNETMLETIVHHLPAGASVSTIVHFGQEMTSGKFCKFDYGAKGNMDHYGQSEPPDYDLGLVKTPIAMFWSDNDWLAQPPDVMRMMSELPNIADLYRIPFHEWNHLDYLFGIDAYTLVYPRILENMQKFLNKENQVII